MGLFGRKKNKKAAKVDPPPSEDPPTTEIASPDDPVVVETVDLSEETPYVEHKDSDEIPKTAALSDRLTATYASILALWFGLSKTTQVAVAAGAAVGAIGVIALVAAGGRAPMFPSHINVAFVGSSYIYVNDLPRVVEQMGGGLGGHITQDSVIHNEATLLQILMSGNGMYNKWATRSAMDRGVAFDAADGTTAYLYDMGACSVPQLLTGSDATITAGNQLGAFIDDGNNPCFQEDAYRQYEEQKGLKHGWDYLVISDLSKNMVFTDTRELTLMAFNYTYAPLLKKKNISPIVIQPHAFDTYGSSGSELEDIVTFTDKIMEGAEIYKKFLNKRIGLFAQAHIAPVGNAFLAVYKESPSTIWPKLFLSDGVHPSAYGTYLYGLVVYATMTGHMPPYKRVVTDDMENSMVFATARRLQATEFPTKDEADFLFKIAKKVAIRGFMPKMGSASSDVSYLRESADDNEANENVYYGDYSNGQDYVGDDASVYAYMYDAQDAENGNYDYENYENQGYEDEDADAEEYEYDEDEEQEDYDEDEQEYDEDEEAEDADYEEEEYQEEEEGAVEEEAEEEADDSSQENDNGYHEAADEYFQNSGQSKNYNQGDFENHDTQYYYSDLQSGGD